MQTAALAAVPPVELDAEKSWITSGPVARYLVLFAMTDPDKAARGITGDVLVVEATMSSGSLITARMAASRLRSNP